MSPETVALVSAVSSAAVGTAAIVASALSARGARRDAERLAKGTRDQTRRESFYVDLLSSFSRRMVVDSFELKHKTSPVEMPSTEELHEQMMRASIFASRDVREAATLWSDAWTAYTEQKGRTNDDKEVEKLREGNNKAFRGLIRAMRRDLHGEE